MAIVSKTFNEVISFTRGTGATRINAAGLIVGVDFSSSSVVFGTGNKTFTLTADANVNRDWPVGSSVRAASQAAPLGEMVGTVVSYDPVTQVLVINVATNTGTGTGTNWRIGSLEARRDAKGILQEPQATNYSFPSRVDQRPLDSGNTITANHPLFGHPGVQLNSAAASQLAIQGGATLGAGSVPATTQTVCHWVLMKLPNNPDQNITFSYEGGGQGQGSFQIPPQDGVIVPVSGNSAFGGAGVSIYRQFFGDIYLVGIKGPGRNASQGQRFIIRGQTDSTGMVLYFGQQEVSSSPTFPIPTTTIAVTRAADSFAATTETIAAIRQGQGTLYVEAETADAGTAQKRALLLSGATGDIRIAKRGNQTAQIQRMASDGVNLLAAVNANTNNTLRDNGKETTEISDGSGAVKFGLAFSAVGKLINVGAAENIRSTENGGLNYMARTIGGTFGGGHFGLNRFVIANSTSVIDGATVGSVIVSPDGERLRRINIPGLNQNLNEITSNTTNGVDGTLYLAVGNGGMLYTSPDAEIWTARTSGVATAFNACAHGTGTFVAVNATAANSRYSTDGGVTWLEITGLTGTMVDVIYTGSQFVAINTVGGVFTSANGQAFTAVTTTGITPAFTTAAGIAFATIGGQGYYVIVGNGGQVAVSQAAANASPATYITYTSGGTPATTTTQQLNEVLAFGTKFYLVGNTQALVEFDPVAITFSARTANVTGNLNGIAASASTLLICGATGAISTSPDGTTFTSRTGNSAQLNGAAFGNGTYVVVGNAVNGSGLIATVDPVTYEYRRRVSGLGNLAARNVKFLNNAFYVCRQGSAGQSGLSVSTDNGVTYAPVNGANALDIVDIAFGAGSYVAIRGNTVNSGAISTNGIDFGAAVSLGNGTQICRAIEFANGLFVTVGDAGQIMTSATGLAGSFVTRTSGTTQNLTSVIYSTVYNAWLVSGANGTMLISYDNAVTWLPVGGSAFSAIDNNGIQANPTRQQWLNGLNRIALSYKANEVNMAINGFAVVQDTSASIPNITSMLFGDNFNGYIKKVRSYRIGYNAANTSKLSLGQNPTEGDNELSTNGTDVLAVNAANDTLRA